MSLKRLFYAFKAWVCLQLDWQWQGDDAWDMQENQDYYLLEKEGGVSGYEYTIYWSSCYGVGFGVFRNWWYFVHSDSSD